MYIQPSAQWVLRLLVVGIAARWAECQELNPCQQYLNFESEKDVSLLTGKWTTIGSTRRVFSCNNIVGTTESPEVIRMDEAFMVPGFVGVWKHEVTSKIKTDATNMEVTAAGFDGVLMPGKLAVGTNGNSLLLVQCSSILWFPAITVTVLSRDVPADPAFEVEEIFRKFNVPSSIPSFVMVNHDGCDKVPQSEIENNGLSSRRSADAGEIKTLSFPGWSIRGPRDRDIVI